MHRIRNAAHPVPDLAADGDWLEAPLWIWTAGDAAAAAAVRRAGSGGEIVLSDRHGLEISLPLAAGGDAGRSRRAGCWNWAARA